MLTTIKCPQCGAAIEISENPHIMFCPYCGTKFKNEVNAISQNIVNNNSISNSIVNIYGDTKQIEYTTITISRNLDNLPAMDIVINNTAYGLINSGETISLQIESNASNRIQCITQDNKSNVLFFPPNEYGNIQITTTSKKCLSNDPKFLLENKYTIQLEKTSLTKTELEKHIEKSKILKKKRDRKFFIVLILSFIIGFSLTQTPILVNNILQKREQREQKDMSKYTISYKNSEAIDSSTCVCFYDITNLSSKTRTYAYEIIICTKDNLTVATGISTHTTIEPNQTKTLFIHCVLTDEAKEYGYNFSQDSVVLTVYITRIIIDNTNFWFTD